MSRPTTSRMRRPNVTNHIIQSHLRSQDPRPISHGSCFVLPLTRLNFQLASFFSRLASPHFRLPPFRALRNSNHVLETLPITTVALLSRAFVRYTGFLVSPMDSYSDAHVKGS